MKNFSVGLILFVAACATKKPIVYSERDLSVAQYTVFSKPHAKKRIYILHGLYGHREDYLIYAHMRAFVDGFLKRGFEVITIEAPSVPYKWRFTGDGANYEDYFLSTFAKNIKEIEKHWGIIRERYIGGISFGGYHAMLAFAKMHIFKEFYAIKPVTRVQELEEYSGLNPVRVDLLQDPKIFAQKKSLILFDKSDTRVNGKLSYQLIKAADPLSSIEFKDTGHNATMEMIDTFFKWWDENNTTAKGA